MDSYTEQLEVPEDLERSGDVAEESAEESAEMEGNVRAVDYEDLTFCRPTPLSQLGSAEIIDIYKDYVTGQASYQETLDRIPRETGWLHPLVDRLESLRGQDVLVSIGFCPLLDESTERTHEALMNGASLTRQTLAFLEAQSSLPMLHVNIRKTCRRAFPKKHASRTSFCLPMHELEAVMMVFALKLELLVAVREFQVKFQKIFTFSAAVQQVWYQVNRGPLHFNDVPREHEHTHLGHLAGDLHIKTPGLAQTSQRNYRSFINVVARLVDRAGEEVTLYESLRTWFLKYNGPSLLGYNEEPQFHRHLKLSGVVAWAESLIWKDPSLGIEDSKYMTNQERQDIQALLKAQGKDNEVFLPPREKAGGNVTLETQHRLLKRPNTTKEPRGKRRKVSDLEERTAEETAEEEEREKAKRAREAERKAKWEAELEETRELREQREAEREEEEDAEDRRILELRAQLKVFDNYKLAKEEEERAGRKAKEEERKSRRQREEEEEMERTRKEEEGEGIAAGVWWWQDEPTHSREIARYDREASDSPFQERVVAWRLHLVEARATTKRAQKARAKDALRGERFRLDMSSVTEVLGDTHGGMLLKDALSALVTAGKVQQKFEVEARELLLAEYRYNIIDRSIYPKD